ncbi:MAG: hypothetical protein ACYTEK_03555 [Planctomycetota bacterium]|jgi:Na+-transporting methylmalonyl-CoA/oxaloacetate decarboxylase gamma subunit
MKRYVISTVIALAILVVAWTALGQEEGRAEPRERARQRFQNMSEEEIEAARRERFSMLRGLFVNPEGKQKSIKVIEEQLATLKAAQMPQFEGRFEDFSEEEQTKLRQKFREATRNRIQALQIIIAQVARLYGRVQLEGEGELYVIASTVELKQIQDMAEKEKAEKTSELLERIITRGSGRRPRGERPQGGQRRSTDQQR